MTKLWSFQSPHGPKTDSFDWVFSWDLGTWSFYWDLSSEWPEALSKWFLETSGLGVVGEREWPHLMPSAGGQLCHHLDQSLLDTCCVWGIKPSAEREVWAVISWGGLELARAMCVTRQLGSLFQGALLTLQVAWGTSLSRPCMYAGSFSCLVYDPWVSAGLQCSVVFIWIWMGQFPQ